MSRVVIEGETVELIVCEWHARKKQRALRGRLDVHGTAGPACAETFADEFSSAREMLDDVTGHNQIECVVRKWKGLSRQIGSTEIEALRQIVIVVIVHAGVMKPLETQAPGELYLSKPETADIENRRIWRQPPIQSFEYGTHVGLTGVARSTNRRMKT
jgi:hypothetical protein